MTDIAVQATAAQGDGAFAAQPRAMPWEGRDRLDSRGYRKVKLDIRVLADTVELRTAALTVEARPVPDNPPTCCTCLCALKASSLQTGLSFTAW